MRTTSASKPLLVMACAVALLGCTLLMDLNEQQCERDADCSTGEFSVCENNVCVAPDESSLPDGTCDVDDDCGASAPRCMNGVCVSAEIAERWLCSEDTPNLDADMVHYTFHVVEFLSRQPPTDMVVFACRNMDLDCEHPVSTFTDTTGGGFAEFDLPSGFFGFFEVNSSDALPSLLYVTKPIVADAENRAVPVLTLSTVELTAQLAQLEFDPAKGLAILDALDCTGNPAGGVHFTESKGDANAFYIVDQLPTSDASVTVYSPADNTADGGFINLQPTTVLFSAYLGVDGLLLGSFNAQIRPSTITFIDLEF